MISAINETEIFYCKWYKKITFESWQFFVRCMGPRLYVLIRRVPDYVEYLESRQVSDYSKYSKLRQVLDHFGYPKLRRVPDHIEYSSCVAYPISSSIWLYWGWPKLRPGSCSFRVPDYFGRRQKHHPTSTQPDPNIGYPNSSSTRNPLMFLVSSISLIFQIF